MKIVALIPARSGSKGLPNKNIMNFKGKPLIAHSIEQALKSKLIDRVIVSTDSAAYAEIALKLGAEVPFLRPERISGDLTLDIEVFQHCNEFMLSNGYQTDFYVHLRPTYPIRNVNDIDNCVNLLIEHNEIDSVRTVVESDVSPFKMYLMDEKHRIIPAAVCDISEAINSPRQILPKAYTHNGCIDIVRSTIIESGSMTGKNIYGYHMEHNYDIDSLEDFIRAENYKT